MSPYRNNAYLVPNNSIGKQWITKRKRLWYKLAKWRAREKFNVDYYGYCDKNGYYRKKSLRHYKVYSWWLIAFMYLVIYPIQFFFE